MNNSNPYIGSSFDDFLKENNLLAEANKIATRKIECALETLRINRRYQQDKLTFGWDRVEQCVEEVEGDWLDNWTDETEADGKTNGEFI